MSLTLGRCALTEDPDGGSITVSGDTLRFSCDITGTSSADLSAKIQQLSGMVDNPDEEVFPFTWSEDPSVDGFYRVRRLDITPAPVYMSSFLASFSVELERLPGYTRPQFETVTTRILRTNDHAVTVPTCLQYVAGPLYDADVAISTGTLTTEDGTLSYQTSALSAASFSWRGGGAPSDYYKSTAAIYLDYTSGTAAAIVGRQIPLMDADGITSEVIGWTLSNGYVSVEAAQVTISATTYWGFKVKGYRSGAWSAATDFIGYGKSGAIWTPFAVTGDATLRGLYTPSVLLNTPEQVVIRVSSPETSNLTSFDFSLRQGDAWIEIATNNVYPGSGTHRGFGLSSGAAATTFTGGIHQTSGTYRPAIVHPQTTATTDTTNLRIAQDSTTVPACWAITPDYQTAISTTPAGFLGMYLGTRIERRRVVPR